MRGAGKECRRGRARDAGAREWRSGEVEHGARGGSIGKGGERGVEEALATNTCACLLTG